MLSVLGQSLRASAVTVAEVLVRPAQTGRLAAVERAVEQMRIEAVGIGPDAPARLAPMRATSGLKLPGCCVLLAAEDVGATAVLTFDERLSRAARDAGYATEPPR